MFAGNFAPRGWAFCNGQSLQITDHTALFSILGTTYGGNGTSNFNLPDMRGRFPTHNGGSTGPGLTARPLGQKSGVEAVTLTSSNLPTPKASTAVGNTRSPAGAIPCVSNDGESNYTNTASNTTMSTENGNNQAHTNMPPYQTVNFIIAILGTYPTQS